MRVISVLNGLWRPGVGDPLNWFCGLFVILPAIFHLSVAIQTIIERHLPSILRLSAQHQVKRLWVLGFVLIGDFSADFEIDFLYEFDEAHLTHEAELDHLLAMIAGQ